MMKFVYFKLALYIEEVAERDWGMYIVFLLQDCLEEWKLITKSAEEHVSRY